MLWVDPDYRNQGIGSLVAENRLLGATGMLRRWWDHPIPQRGAAEEISASAKTERARSMWSHADVDEKNTGSRKVCEGLGGVRGWTVVWIRVDVEMLETECIISTIGVR